MADPYGFQLQFRLHEKCTCHVSVTQVRTWTPMRYDNMDRSKNSELLDVILKQSIAEFMFSSQVAAPWTFNRENLLKLWIREAVIANAVFAASVSR